MNLRDAVFHRNTTQRALAKKVGCSEQLLSMHVRGKRKLTDSVAKKCAKFLRCKVQLVDKSAEFEPLEAVAK